MTVMTLSVIIVITNQTLTITNENKTVADTLRVLSAYFNLPDANLNDIIIGLFLLIEGFD